MKAKLLLALVSMAAMFTGCNKENVEDFATGKQPTSFNVSVDGGVQTRAYVTPPAEAPSRYVMEIYKGATAAGGTFVSHKEQATGTFTDVVLDNAQEYTILFWADYGTPSADGTHPAANEYNASDLKAALIAKQPTKAAFAGLSRFTVGTTEESVYTQVTLTHAVAQVNFLQTEALTAANNMLVVSFDKSCSLNVDGNAATEISGAVQYTFTRDGDKTAGTLGTSYIIAATSTPKTMLDITATLNGETAKAISNVPFERNYRTNISGAYSNKYDATLTATCEADWGTPDYNEDIKEESGATYEIGSPYPNATNPIGVIFWIDPNDAKKGKIVSLDEPESNWGGLNPEDGYVDASLPWQSFADPYPQINATDKSNGITNMNFVKEKESWQTKYIAFAWCAQKSEGVLTWYLPALYELEALYCAYVGAAATTWDSGTPTLVKDESAAKKFNDAIAGCGGSVLRENQYWSSTESDNNNAMVVSISSNGEASSVPKYNYPKVRAIAAIELAK